MEFSLLKQKLTFPVSQLHPNISVQQPYESRSTSATLKLQRLKGSNALDELNFQRFASLLQENLVTTRVSSKTLPPAPYEKPNVNNSWKVTVLVKLGGTIGRWDQTEPSFIQLQDDIANTGGYTESIFQALQRAAKQAQCCLKLKIEVLNWKNSKSFDSGEHSALELRTLDATINDLTASLTNKAQQLFANGNMYDWNPAFHRNPWVGTFTITGILYPRVFEIPFGITKKQPTVNQSILLDEIQADIVIKSKDNKDIKSHRAFLCVHSSVFRTMFHKSYQESKTGVVDMTDMTETGVRALLAYLYYSDVKEPTEKCSTALELLKAGHKYDIRPLETKMQNILLQKEDSWYHVEVAMQLFLFSRNVEGQEKLKMRSVSILKKNYKELLESESYDKMFNEDRSASKELCQLAFSV